MLELLEKAVMTAIGVAAITQKKAEELAVEMRDKYKMSEDEGKLFVDRIQAIASESREKVREMAESEVRKVVERLGVVPREEFDCLAKRVQELESKQNG
jgi:polyhydroxyalkanoate synthesis regulator phasin